MTNTPDGLPTLSRGSHRAHDGEACVMEYVSLLAGEDWTDRPRCTHPMLSAAARVVNDSLHDDARHLMIPLIGRLFGTNPYDWYSEKNSRLVGALALWLAKSVRYAVKDDEQVEADEMIASLEHWLSAGTHLHQYPYTFSDLAYVTFMHGHSPAHKVISTAVRLDGGPPNIVGGGYVAANAMVVPVLASGLVIPLWRQDESEMLVGLLSRFIDEFDRLTGRTETPEVSDETLADLTRQVVGV